MRSVLALLLLAAQAPVLPPAGPGFPLGKVVEKVVCAADPKESYSLYLPGAYTPDRPWPILYVLDPRSRGTLAAKAFRAGAERYGYILASSNNSLSDTSIDPNVEAMRAMWADTHARLAIDDKRIYAAGFSGTVRSCCALARAVPGTIAGIIGAGAGFPFHEPPKKGDPFVFFGTLGDKDFNYYEVMDLEPALREAGITHRVEIFDGVHQWPPEELASRAIGWLELQAMKTGTRPRDAAVIEDLWTRTLDHARAAEAAGDLFQAQRYYAGAAADFAGLRADVTAASARAAALAASPALQRDWKQRAERLRHDKELLTRAPGILSSALAASDEPATLTLSRAVAALKIHELRAKARDASDPDERLSAQRALNTINVQTSYYLPQLYRESKRYDRVAFVLSIAAEITPDNPDVWYDRARAYALQGDRKHALADLQQAIDKGWKDGAALQKDDDLASLRQDPEYQRLLATLEPRKPNP